MALSSKFPTLLIRFLKTLAQSQHRCRWMVYKQKKASNLWRLTTATSAAPPSAWQQGLPKCSKRVVTVPSTGLGSFLMAVRKTVQGVVCNQLTEWLIIVFPVDFVVLKSLLWKALLIKPRNLKQSQGIHAAKVLIGQWWNTTLTVLCVPIRAWLNALLTV